MEGSWWKAPAAALSKSGVAAVACGKAKSARASQHNHDLVSRRQTAKRKWEIHRENHDAMAIAKQRSWLFSEVSKLLRATRRHDNICLWLFPELHHID